MATKTKKTTTKKPTKTATKKANGSSKTAQVIALMKRASGVTRAEVLELTGWKAVSMQQVAASGGVKIKLEKVEGKPTVYRCNNGV